MKSSFNSIIIGDDEFIEIIFIGVKTVSWFTTLFEHKIIIYVVLFHGWSPMHDAR